MIYKHTFIHDILYPVTRVTDTVMRATVTVTLKPIKVTIVVNHRTCHCHYM